jgi:hypothetical protein
VIVGHNLLKYITASSINPTCSDEKANCMQQQSHSPPYTIRHSQSLGSQTPEKAQLLGLQAEAGGSLPSSLALSSDNQGQELLSPERREADQLQSLEASVPQQSPQQTGQIQSPLKQHNQHQQVF